MVDLTVDEHITTHVKDVTDATDAVLGHTSSEHEGTMSMCMEDVLADLVSSDEYVAELAAGPCCWEEVGKQRSGSGQKDKDESVDESSNGKVVDSNGSGGVQQAAVHGASSSNGAQGVVNRVGINSRPFTVGDGRLVDSETNGGVLQVEVHSGHSGSDNGSDAQGVVNGVGNSNPPFTVGMVTVVDNVEDSMEEEESTIEEEVVWGGDASLADIREIERMIESGSGVFGNANCKLELRMSLLQGAGRGVFVKNGSVIYDGECITEYSGTRVRTDKHLSVEEKLRSIEVGGANGRSVIVVGMVLEVF